MAHNVEFKKSGKSVAWSSKYESILELAEANGITIDNDCGQGICGTCMVRLLSGKVEMAVDDGLDESDRKAGMILSCTAVPLSDIVLET
ncbi:MAG: 2Fe-2S iron-sulfur cluster binding domain-containing protein [Desulfobacteraceae bacterium]|jgi:ferredoxin|nr:2Fe-2S iron-sulfur cluster binding domain-containing protein [Desulfobacteraceae bacterium]